MAFYGFRLFQVELRQANGRRPHAMQDCEGEHYAVVAERLLKGMQGKVKRGSPLPPGDPEELPTMTLEQRQGQPAFRVEWVERLGHMIRGELLYGRYGDFHKGLGDDNDGDVDLDGLAATRLFRFLLNLPATGTRGVLAVEDISRTSPSENLQRWLKAASQEEGASKVREAREAEGAKKGEVSVGSAAEDLANACWWKLSLVPAADEDHLRRLIQNGKLQRIELIKRGRRGDRQAEVRELELTAPNLDEGMVLAALNAVGAWTRSLLAGDDGDGEEPEAAKVTDAEAAAQLAAVLGPEVEALEFDDGYVVISDSSGKVKQISPSRLSEYFTYSLARDRQPSRLAFWRAARDTARRVGVATKTAGLDWSHVD